MSERRPVVSFVCDDPEVERLLARLEQQVLEHGGRIHHDVRVHCEAGELSVQTASAAEPDKVLISLPERALLPTDGLALHLAGDRLELPSSAGMDAGRRAMFETMLALYNATGKMTLHRRFSPWLALASEKGTLHRIIAGRNTAPAVRKMAALFDAGKFNELATDSFLKTRVLGFRSGQGSTMEVVMPFIDFMNHHPAAGGFRTGANAVGTRMLAVTLDRPVEDSDECFVRYGFYDAYDIFLSYGYVEAGAPFVRSIPMTLELDGIGSIEVGSRIGVKFPQGKLPQYLAPIRRFMPMIARRGPNALEISHLLIPAGEPAFALRRALGTLVGGLRPNLDPIALNHQVALAEKTVLLRNIEFYETLLRNLADSSVRGSAAEAVAMARRMAEIQLEKLRGYRIGGA